MDSISTMKMANAATARNDESSPSASVNWVAMIGAMIEGANRPPNRAIAPAVPMPLARRSVGYTSGVKA
ncbi:hypothetical protein D3C71_2245120 [compost metagenome]